jgi:hypothetical protein
MALKKYIKYGTKEGEYLRILGVHPNTLYSSSLVRVAVYKNEEERQKAEENYVLVIPVTVKGSGHTIEDIYKILKDRPEFEEAQDC